MNYIAEFRSAIICRLHDDFFNKFAMLQHCSCLFEATTFFACCKCCIYHYQVWACVQVNGMLWIYLRHILLATACTCVDPFHKMAAN